VTTTLEQNLGLTPVPSDPQTAASAAAAKLAELKASPQFCSKYLEGSQAEREEFNRLTSMIAAATPVMDTNAADAALHEKETSAALLYLNASGGLEPGIIEQLADPNRTVTRAEFQMAKARKQAWLADAQFRARYLAGDMEAVRALHLCSIILSSAVKD
jgi:hypothetical protein